MERTQAEAFEQYIRDLRVVRSISRPSFPEGKAPAAVLEEIQSQRAEMQHPDAAE